MTRAALILLLLASCTVCDDPPFYSLSSISFSVYEDDQEFFKSDDLRKSLKITNLETKAAVEFGFHTTTDHKTLSSFSLLDRDFDEEALAGYSCRSYLLSYDATEIDTLKVCMKQKNDKCDGREIMDVNISWNDKHATYEYFVVRIEK